MVRRGYKQTEVGEIPGDWDSKPLDNMATSISSGTSNTKPENGDYPLYGSTGRIGYKAYFDYEGEKILVARVGANAGTVNKISGKYCVSDNTLIVNLSNDVDLAFFYFQLIRRNLNNLVFGSGQPLLTGGQLKELNLAVPRDKCEQTQIATALSDVDGLIASLENLIAKKRDIKTATMQQLLTGKKRLPGFGEGKGYKQTELGEIPEDWNVKKLGEFLRYEQPTKYLVSDTDYSDNGEVPVLTAGKTFILGYTHEEHGVFISLPVIIFDDFTTDTKFVDFQFKAKSSAMKMLLPRNEDVDLHYIYSAMQMIEFPLGDHKRHWIGEYQHLKIAVPSLCDEFEAISKTILHMSDEIVSLVKKLNKTKAIKQGMMQELLTGRTRLVETDNKPGAAVC